MASSEIKINVKFALTLFDILILLSFASTTDYLLFCQNSYSLMRVGKIFFMNGISRVSS